MWICQKCNTPNGKQLVACAQCGTSFDGDENLLFEDEKAELLNPKPRQDMVGADDAATEDLELLRQELAKLNRSDSGAEEPQINDRLHAALLDHASKSVHNELRKLEARHQDRSAECFRCGSEKVIPEVMVVDENEGYEKNQQLRFDVDKEAWVFRQSTRVTLFAQVCGDCGHVEHYLKSDQAEQLWDAYQRHLRLRR